MFSNQCNRATSFCTDHLLGVFKLSGEMTQWLRELPALLKDLSSHHGTESSQLPLTLAPGNLTASGLLGYSHTHMTYI